MIRQNNYRFYYYFFILFLIIILQFTINVSFREVKSNLNLQEERVPKASLTSEGGYFYGGSDNDYGNAVDIDNYGNICIAGDTTPFGTTNSRIFLLKYNITGNLQWNSSWFGGYRDFANDLIVDSENSSYIVGYSYNATGANDYDILLLKFNSSGDLIWNKTWGTLDDEYGYGIGLDSYGNIYLSGYSVNKSVSSDSDIVLVKYNKTGDYQWNRTWGGSFRDEGRKLYVDKTSGDIFISGYTRSFGTANSYDLLILKYNSSGDYQWNRTFGGSEQEYGMSITLDSNGCIIVTGKGYNYATGNYDVLILKYNNLGEFQWNATWSGSDNDIALDLVIDSEDSILLTGYKELIGFGDSDAFLLKFDYQGDFLYEYIWGGIDDDAGRGIAIDIVSGKLFIVGRTLSYGGGLYDCFLVKYSLGPSPFLLSTDQFNLFWTASTDAKNYSIYMSTNPIDEIDENLNVLIEGVTDNSYKIPTLDDDSYYFIVIAFNSYDSMNSNSINIIIQFPQMENSTYDFLIFSVIITSVILIGLVISILYLSQEKFKIKDLKLRKRREKVE